MVNKDKTMEELQGIKEECSLHYLSLTPEGRKRLNADVMQRAGAAMGRAVVAVNHPRLCEAAKEELAQV